MDPNGFNLLSLNFTISLNSKPNDANPLSIDCLAYDKASVPVSLYASSSVYPKSTLAIVLN